VVLVAGFVTSFLIALGLTIAMLAIISWVAYALGGGGPEYDELFEVINDFVDQVAPCLQTLGFSDESIMAIKDFIQESFDAVMIMLCVGLGLGSILSFYLVIKGIMHTLQVYARAYSLFWASGPSSLRFPLRRANALRLYSTFVSFQLFGIINVLVAVTVVALLVATLVVPGPVSSFSRGVVLSLVSVQLAEMLFFRTVVVPFFQSINCGPALYASELWYLNTGLIKGLTRLIMQTAFMLISFFTPAKCAFYDGTESWDTGHLSFVCYVMKRVEADKNKLAAAQKLFRARMGTAQMAALERSQVETSCCAFADDATASGRATGTRLEAEASASAAVDSNQAGQAHKAPALKV